MTKEADTPLPTTRNTVDIAGFSQEYGDPRIAAAAPSPAVQRCVDAINHREQSKTLISEVVETVASWFGKKSSLPAECNLSSHPVDPLIPSARSCTAEEIARINAIEPASPPPGHRPSPSPACVRR